MTFNQDEKFLISAPDLTEKVVGVRGFYHNSTLELGDWLPGVNTAFCRKLAAHSRYGINYGFTHCCHDDKAIIPVEGCGCGLYAYYNRDRFNLNGQYGPLWAAVVGWGKVMLAQDGWRAQYAEIVALAVSAGVSPDNMYLDKIHYYLLSIAEKYGVPIVHADDLEQVALKYGSPVPKSLIPVNAPEKYWNDYLAYSQKGVIPAEVPTEKELQTMTRQMQSFYERVKYIKSSETERHKIRQEAEAYKLLYPRQRAYSQHYPSPQTRLALDSVERYVKQIEGNKRPKPTKKKFLGFGKHK